MWVLVWPRGGYGVESSDVGLRGPPKALLEAYASMMGKRLTDQNHITHKNLSSVNPTYTNPSGVLVST